MKGISTRNYQEVIPRMAETVSVSKSNISREFIAICLTSEKAMFGRR
jgi:hypothetical protein